MSAAAKKLLLPREDLIRGKVRSGVALRADEGDDQDTGPMMVGHFAVFNQWTEINSWEGNFMERFAPGAFKKTIRETRDQMTVLFQHGYDPVLGEQVIGEIEELREDSDGVYYEVKLLDGIPELILDGLRKNLYGASFRFSVPANREEVEWEPEPSDFKTQGIPERTVKETKVPEFGPVTFPAYEGASASVRSSLHSLNGDELELAARFARLAAKDEAQARALAVRFATLDPERHLTSPGTPEETEEVTPEETVEPAVKETKGTDVTPEPEGEGDQDVQDAPPEGSAEPEAHPDRGRRAQKRLPPWQPTAKKTPPWRSSDKEKK